MSIPDTSNLPENTELFVKEIKIPNPSTPSILPFYKLLMINENCLQMNMPLCT